MLIVVVVHPLCARLCVFLVSFFFNDAATTEIYTYWHTLSLHDARPICISSRISDRGVAIPADCGPLRSINATSGKIDRKIRDRKSTRVNSITTAHLVCRLLLENKHKTKAQARAHVRTTNNKQQSTRPHSSTT